ncbi:MAG: hypothetical protein DRO67_09220 [Candidatus Asgardarchaeum californiense]|nr:MAG: hypothetical protein DRO67_09220 [Candidatus Asgardarchaeum californiense]
MLHEDDFTVYGPYFNGRYNRKIVIVVDKNGIRRTVSYPKWIMELQIGKVLDPDDTIDHFDGDINNNDINNLRIVPRKEHSADDTKRVKKVKLQCAWCNKTFERSPRLLREKARKGKAGPFCSRSCAGKYSRQLQQKLIDKMKPQKAVDSEYYKRKHAQTFIEPVSFEIFVDYLCDIWD